jgi:para-aminobenzoate synthetase component 1
MRLKNFINQLNEWGQNRVPFLFLIDFELEQPKAWRADQVDADQMLYSLNSFSNTIKLNPERKEIQLKKISPLHFWSMRKSSIGYLNIFYGEIPSWLILPLTLQ